ncbi:MAG: O-antigen ligase family protein, partial [Candidatus Cloacimonetes bacterium]|nr:O-antigen ligase family protein [Candidatus Cloacimonadota bacterium]
MKTIRLLLYLLLLTLPLGQFSKISLPIGGISDVSVYLNDILLPLLLGIWFFYKLGVKKSLKLPPLSGNIFLFAAIAGISLFASLTWVGISQFLVAALYLWRWMMYAGIYFVVWDLVKTQNSKLPPAPTCASPSASARRGLRRAGKTQNYNLKLKTVYDLRLPAFLAGLTIIRMLLIAVSIFAIAGLIQFVFFPDFSKYIKHGWDPHYYRVLSTFFDPNFAGIFLTLGLLLLLSLQITPNKLRQNKLLFTLYSLLFTLPILLTFSRSTYLAFLVGVGILGLIKSRRLLFVLLLFSFSVFLFVPRARTRVSGAVNLDVTARARIENWQETLAIIKDNFLFGVGFNTFRYAQENYGYFRDARGVPQPSGHAGAGADSSFLFVLATTGIFGFFVYLILLFRLWLIGRQKFHHADGLTKALGLTMVVSMPALVIHSQFVNSLFYPWIMEWM